MTRARRTVRFWKFSIKHSCLGLRVNNCTSSDWLFRELFSSIRGGDIGVTFTKIHELLEDSVISFSVRKHCKHCKTRQDTVQKFRFGVEKLRSTDGEDSFCFCQWWTCLNREGDRNITQEVGHQKWPVEFVPMCYFSTGEFHGNDWPEDDSRRLTRRTSRRVNRSAG